MIPEDAKSVFKGVIFEVFQWDQQMFDGSEETFEALRRPDSTTVIGVVGNQILIQDEIQPHLHRPILCLPGGRVEEDEDPLESAKREFLEETGYTSENWQLLLTTKTTSKIDWTNHIYIAKNCVKSQDQELDAGEKIETRLVLLEDLVDIVDDDPYLTKDSTLRIDFNLRLLLLKAKYNRDTRDDLKAKFFD